MTMWRKLTLVVIVSFSVVRLSVSDCSSGCGNVVNSTAPLHFLHDAPKQLFSKPMFFSVYCCADGFTDIEWHYQSSADSAWRAWPWFEPCKHCGDQVYRELCDLNQTLQFIDVLPSDSGNYRCNISNSITGQHRLRQYQVVVKNCRDVKEVQFLEEPDSDKQSADLGSNMTLTCAGYFGCPRTGDLVRQANWTYTDATSHTHLLLPGKDEHFLVEYNRSFPDITVGSSLTILGVTKRDYQLTFTCHVSTRSSQRTWNITLQQPGNIEQLNLRIIIISVCCVSCLVLLVVSALSFYCCFKAQVDFTRRRLCGTLITRAQGVQSIFSRRQFTT